MARRKRRSPFRRLAIEVILAFSALGLIWIATEFGLQNKLGEKLLAPLAPKPVASNR